MSFVNKLFGKKEEYNDPLMPDPVMSNQDPLMPNKDPLMPDPQGPPPGPPMDFNPNMNEATGTPIPKEQSFHEAPQQEHHELKQANIDKDLQIIITKLDLLKAELDNINQRVQRIEKHSEDKKPNYSRW